MVFPKMYLAIWTKYVVWVVTIFLLLLIAARIEANENLLTYFAQAMVADGPVPFVESDAVTRDLVWSPDNKWIAYGSKKSGNEDIWIQSASDGKSIQVTFNPGLDLYPTWSPDGKTLVWASDRGGATHLWMKDPWGSDEPKQLTDNSESLVGTGVSITSFSPNGKWIAYAAIVEGNEDIWIRNIESDKITRLTMHPDRDLVPSVWSPDGKEIVFSSGRNEVNEGNLWVVNVNNKKERQLTDEKGWEWGADWSHNGKYIAYSCSQEWSNRVSLCITTPDGNLTRKLQDEPYFGSFLPTWALGDSIIAFGGGPNKQTLSFLDKDSGQKSKLPVSGQVIASNLSPKGTQLVLAIFDKSQSQIVLKKQLISDSDDEMQEIVRIPQSDWQGGEMKWAHDESSILLKTQDLAGNQYLRLLDSENRSIRDLIRGKDIILNENPWSNSDKRIAFVMADADSLRDLYTISIKSNKKRQITFGGAVSDGYDWSPDGRLIVYSGKDEVQKKLNLFSVPVTRGTPQSLLNWDESDERDPTFSPDGKYIAFISNRNDANALWILDPATGETTLVSNESFNPIWNTDSNGLIYSNQGQIYRYDIMSNSKMLIHQDKSWSSVVGISSERGLLIRQNVTGIWLIKAGEIEPNSL